jgi:uncharacterized protein YaeQ
MAETRPFYKAELEIVDLDRHYYETHKLTLAGITRETDERLMIRLLPFAAQRPRTAWNSGKGISDSEERDYGGGTLTGEIEIWIELGHPEPACSLNGGQARKSWSIPTPRIRTAGGIRREGTCPPSRTWSVVSVESDGE